MRRSLNAMVLAGSISIGACSNSPRPGEVRNAAGVPDAPVAVGVTDRIGSAAAPAATTAIPGNSVLEGAIAGAVVGGLPGAIWTDWDHDGRVDGYTYNGRYYQGAPANNPARTAAPSSRIGERG